MTRHQCSVTFGWQPTNDLTALPVDLWGQGHDADSVLGVAGGGDAVTSGAGAVPLRSTQQRERERERELLGQQKNKTNKHKLEIKALVTKCPVAFVST